MKLFWKIIILVVILAVAGGIFIYFGGQEYSRLITGTNVLEQKQGKPLAPVENKQIDSAMSDLDKLVNDDGGAAVDGSDATTVTGDSTELNNYLTTYDEKEF